MIMSYYVSQFLLLQTGFRHSHVFLHGTGLVARLKWRGHCRRVVTPPRHRALKPRAMVLQLLALSGEEIQVRRVDAGVNDGFWLWTFVNPSVDHRGVTCFFLRIDFEFVLIDCKHPDISNSQDVFEPEVTRMMWNGWGGIQRPTDEDLWEYRWSNHI